MNRQVVLFHLREAAEELNRTIQELARNRKYSEEALEVAMGHAYHHLNTAWNGRNQTDMQFRDCTDRDFNQFRRFPKETEFVYLDAQESEPAAAPNRRPARRRPIRKSRKGGGR
jgi:hypothetical protein